MKDPLFISAFKRLLDKNKRQESIEEADLLTLHGLLSFSQLEEDDRMWMCTLALCKENPGIYWAILNYFIEQGFLNHFPYKEKGMSLVHVVISVAIQSSTLPQAAEGGNQAILISTQQMISFLLQVGADINAKDAEGRTPLHYAAVLSKNNNTALHLVSFLLGEGACPTQGDKQGNTPEQYAHLKENHEAIEIFNAFGQRQSELSSNIPLRDTTSYFQLRFPS